MEKSDPIIEVIAVEQPVEDRYTRLRQLGWDIDRLKDAWALVVGAGALGNEVLKNLAMVGWGHILVIDLDSIEESNLSRSVLFRQSDVGVDHYKAVVAAQRVRELNPDVEILPVVGAVQERLGLGVFRRMDVVFGCLDNIQARLDINKACFQTITPYIDAGLNGINGDVQVFIPPYTACYGCNTSEEIRRKALDRHACLKVKTGIKPTIPTAPTISSICAAWQVQVAIKLVHNLAIPAGQRILIAGSLDTCDKYQLDRRDNCLDHDPLGIVNEDEITGLPYSVDKITLIELFRLVREDCGMGQETILQLNKDFLEKGICPKCERTYAINSPLNALYYHQIVCPECKKELILQQKQYFYGNEPYAGKMLSEIGIAPLEILEFKNYSTGEYRLFELCHDYMDFFSCLKPTDPKILLVELDLPDKSSTELRLPKRLEIHHLLSWKGREWNLSSGKFEVQNISQGFTYHANDTLESRCTKPHDKIYIRRKP